MTKQMNRHSVETKSTARPNNSSRDMISAFMKVSLKDAQTDAHIQKKIEFFRKNYPKLERMTDHDSMAYRHLSQTCSLLARQILQEVQSKTGNQTRH